MAIKLFTLPNVVKTAPKVGSEFYTINLHGDASKLSPLRILTRKWVGGDVDARRLKYNNVFMTFAAAKAARAGIFKALASN